VIEAKSGFALSAMAAHIMCAGGGDPPQPGAAIAGPRKPRRDRPGRLGGSPQRE